MRLNLKLAILKAGATQRRIAAEADIPENRLSEIVCGWTEPRPDERARLATVLKQDQAVLFDADTSIELRSIR